MLKAMRITTLTGLAMVLVCGYMFMPRSYADETLTITTYYPSPYGSYNELQTNKLAVGDTNGDGQLSSADQPPANGQLYTARSVIYKPQSSLPAFDTMEGEVVYQSSDKKFYYYDGSAWVAQAGGGTTVLTLSCAWGTDYRAGMNHGWDGSCTPPSCPSGYTSAATYSEPVSVACSGFTNCGWDATDYSSHPVAVGRSVRVCVK